jgi:hypothetical protein
LCARRGRRGWGPLFKGLAPNYVKVVPPMSIAFVTYEQVNAVGWAGRA